MSALCDYCKTSLLHQTCYETDNGTYCDSTCAELAEPAGYSPELSLAYTGQQFEINLNRKEESSLA